MNIKVLSKYIEICKEFDKIPSWKGLNLFNKVFK